VALFPAKSSETAAAAQFKKSDLVRAEILAKLLQRVQATLLDPFWT